MRRVWRAIDSSTGSTPRPGRSGTAIAPLSGQDRRLDDVLAIVLVRARDVAGEREAGQAGDGDVGGPADAELVHPAAPDGHAAAVAVVVHPPGLEQAAQAADLDVDDPAGPQVERLAGVVGRVNALVEADRRLELGLEPGVVDDVVVGQRLLDQEQVEGVELAEAWRCRPACRPSWRRPGAGSIG